MPEGPEVKKLTDRLNRNLKNKELVNITINSGRYKKHNNLKNFSNFIKILPIKVKEVKCKGKFIYMIFDNNEYVLFITLGMTGWFRFSRTEKIHHYYEVPDKHDNITFYFKDFEMYFNDFRNFGTMMFMTPNDLEKKLKTLGVDILDKNPDVNLFLKKVEKKRDDVKIAKLLLDQKVIAGVGNYLRADGLFLAKINPHTIIRNISEKDLIELFNILRILAWFQYNENIARKLNMKSIINNIINNYDHFIVYMQDTIKYKNKTFKVIREDLGGRTIHWVPEVQTK
jgi:DNA-formamidopyrimidine glycosylase